MKKHSMIRLAAFALIVGLSILFSISFANEIHISTMTKPVDTENMSDIQIDGADFTPFFRLLGNTFNSFMLFLVLVINLLVIAIVSIISCTVFRLAAIRKTTVINDTEMHIAKKLFYGSAGISVVSCLVITAFTYIIPVLLYIGIWWLNTALICYLPIKDHYWKDDLPVS